jgi:hypothetical protein
LNGVRPKVYAIAGIISPHNGIDRPEGSPEDDLGAPLGGGNDPRLPRGTP